jgi:hypothetical protein
MNIPRDLQSIILEFTYGRRFHFDELYTQMNFVSMIQCNIHPIFFYPVCLDINTGMYVPNPYREGFPHHDTVQIHNSSIFSPEILHIPDQLQNNFFKGRYKGPIVRKFERLFKDGFKTWNRLFFSFFVDIKKEHLLPEYSKMFEIVDSLFPIDTSFPLTFLQPSQQAQRPFEVVFDV